jgi:hypothetical protein
LVNAGKNWIRDKLGEVTSTLGKYVQWGTGGTAANATDTGVQTPTNDENRVAGTIDTATNYVYKVTSATITVATSGKSITELCLLDTAGTGFSAGVSPATGGTLIIRQTFTALPLDVGDSITPTITITIS